MLKKILTGLLFSAVAAFASYPGEHIHGMCFQWAEAYAAANPHTCIGLAQDLERPSLGHAFVQTPSGWADNQHPAPSGLGWSLDQWFLRMYGRADFRLQYVIDYDHLTDRDMQVIEYCRQHELVH